MLTQDGGLHAPVRWHGRVPRGSSTRLLLPHYQHYTQATCILHHGLHQQDVTLQLHLSLRTPPVTTKATADDNAAMASFQTEETRTAKHAVLCTS